MTIKREGIEIEERGRKRKDPRTSVAQGREEVTPFNCGRRRGGIHAGKEK